jgi:microcystin-dependent protein
MSLPALHNAADTRSITERVNVLIRDYNNPPAPIPPIPPQRLVPTGAVLPFAGTTAPAGFLLCAGQAVSRTAYGDLFAAIGTAYGAGDGSTTFNVPDLRGRIVAGKDDMGGTDAGRLNGGVTNRTTLGGAGGTAMHTLTSAEMPAHVHGNAAGSGFVVYGGGSGIATLPNGVEIPLYTAGLTSAGGGGAHNNTQPTIVLNYVIGT